MKHRNCPNCAAPYDVSLVRCPYCNTAYFDMSVIDFDMHEPFFLKIKSGGMCITQLVRPITSAIDVTNESVDCIGGAGNKIASFTSNLDVSIDISFMAVPQPGGKMMEVVKVDD